MAEESSRQLECSGAHCSAQHEDPPSEHEADGADLPDTQTSFHNAGEACQPDSQGRYGSSGGEIQYMEYNYQLETKPDIPEAVVTYSIIPLLENRISNIVVPVLFEETCSRSGTRRIRRRLQGLEGGFTRFPPDRTEPSAQCQGSLMDSINNCYVIVGNATVYSQSPLDESILERARAFVIKGMEEGVFDNLHDGIVGVHYRIIEESTTTAQVENSSSNDSYNTKVWGPIVGVVGACAVVLAVAVLVRRQKKKQQRRGSNVPIGIRPLTIEDYSEREFNVQTKSSWNVLQQTPSAKRQELGISARELADSPPRDFGQSIRSSWNVLPHSPSSQQELLRSSSQEKSFMDLGW